MSFNEQGEIIRCSTAVGSNNDPPPPDDYGSTSYLGCFIILIFYLFIVLDACRSCNVTDSNYYGKIKTKTDTLSPYINYYDAGKGEVTFYITSLENSEVKIKVDGEPIETLYQSCATINAASGGTATVSKILSAGLHSVIATDDYGRNCAFGFRVVEGECQIQELKLKQPKLNFLDPKFSRILNGDWYGKACSDNVNERWDVLLSSNDSTGKYNISYPSLGCGGIWNVTNALENTIYFTEHIFYGLNKYTDLQDVELKIISMKRIQLKYYYHNERSMIAEVIIEKL